MRSRKLATAIGLCIVCGGGAVASYLEASKLRSEGEWHLARANAEAREYAATFDGEMAERELASFQKRREVLERAQGFEQLQKLATLAAVLFAIAATLLYFFRRVSQLEIRGEPGPAERALIERR